MLPSLRHVSACFGCDCRAVAFGLEFFVVAALVVFLTGISKSGFGAGVEMLAVPIMALFIAPQAAAAIMLPILVMIDWANFWRYRNDWVKGLLILLVPAALCGIVLGALTFQFLNAEFLKFGLGILTLAFVGQRMLLNKRGGETRNPGKPLTLLLGVTGGFTSFVAHAGGPPIKMVLFSQELPKKQFVATNSYLFGLINFLKVLPYFLLGQFSTQNLSVSLSLAPLVPLGVLVGYRLNGIVSQLLFERIVTCAMVLAGIKLLWDGRLLIY